MAKASQTAMPGVSRRAAWGHLRRIIRPPCCAGGPRTSSHGVLRRPVAGQRTAFVAQPHGCRVRPAGQEGLHEDSCAITELDRVTGSRV